ncbi:ABC transporter substrate-binding protein [Cryobacterium sp. BB307]|uniref:heme/hemin ABC transporter substrate-binding protein n=1 Tax=Cryobacterium sp. BB307 TaxID=2716317 RepID=UPI001445EAF0|nr:ABC transporter substrate-binding protein [Cryobacterium sp. BB307]
MTRRLPALLSGLVVVAVALTGCQAATSEPSTAPTASGPLVPLAEADLLDNPKDYVGESVALLRELQIKPITSSPAQELPAQVTSHDPAGDRNVTVTDTSRIIGLDISGSIAATIYGLGLGDNLVGRDSSTTFPPVGELPLVTRGGHTINSEAVLSLRPSVIVTDGTVGPLDALLQLRDAGVPVVFVKAEPGVSGVADLTRQVAAALGATDSGELLATSLTADIDAKIAEIAAISPKPADRLRMVFLYLRGASGIYYLFGQESGADQLIEAVGGIDVATEIGWEGMRPMTDEAIIAANPDLILVMSDGLESAGGVDGLLEAKPALALTTAGKNERFVSMADGEILSFGPRTADVLDALARAIYAP